MSMFIVPEPLFNADMGQVSNAYLEALRWYRNLLTSIDNETEAEQKQAEANNILN